jgi:iron-sulfur cluster assembly accessory protein
MATDHPDQTPVVTLSEAAARRIRSLIDGEGVDGAFVRVSLEKKGGTRPRHSVAIEDEAGEADVAFEHRGVRLLVDRLQVSLLQGSEVDYVEDGGGHFVVSNPNLVPLALGQIPGKDATES